MDLFSVILQPLILISGVALLIVSTVARLGQLESELWALESGEQSHLGTLRPHLLARVKRFCRALNTLYASVGLLALASLLGAVLQPFTAMVTEVVLTVTCLAIVALLGAVVLLISDSRFSAVLLQRRIAMTVDPKGN